MFLFKLILSPLLVPIAFAQLIVGTVIRTMLIGLVAVVALGHARGEMGGTSLLDQGIDELKERVVSLNSAELITVSSGWYNWAKSHLPSLAPSDCPQTRKV